MTSPPSPLNRRRVLSFGSAAAAAAGLASWWRYSRAANQAWQPEPADGRPMMKGRAPAIFIGHGSPMNALQDNNFTRTLRRWGHDLGLPRAILVVSAHWLTERSVQVSVATQPETIHDFGGFPAALHAMRYPAPGAPAQAQAAAARLAPRRVAGQPRGLDHGAWTVLRHLYPAANVPVFQLSIDITQPGAYHHALGRSLAALRDDGVLILGSGNVVHNLDATMRGQPDSARGLAPWADDFDTRIKQALDAGDTAALLAYERLGPGAAMAVPFPDHYFPMLYALGAAQSGERARHVFEGFQAGTLSMRCLQWG
ncbi:MAG: 4,5-DOPA dioxygenase extradiol [Burkholderiales bacterium]